MSTLEYNNGPGPDLSQVYNYSQLVQFPDSKVVKLSGQGGWDETGAVDAADWKGQIHKAFDNVERVLRAAGLRGWEDVFLLRTYQTNMPEHFEYFIEVFKERVQSHRPVWTALGVKALGLPSMSIEIEVEAYRGRN